jgi:uncharacterized Fe-S cluster-containing radical SAM superfamily enzyme
VEPDALLSALEGVVRFKGIDDAEVHIDGMGDPGTYPHIVRLVKEARSIRSVAEVTMQTRLITMSESTLRELARAGLGRINLSLDSLDPTLARKLAGTEWYNVDEVIRLMRVAVDLGVRVIIAPVWLPGINDAEIRRIVTMARGLGAGGLPPVLIQKYIPHRRGRKVRVRVMGWGEFWSRLRDMEGGLGVRLIPTPGELNIHRAPQLPKPYGLGERVRVEIISRGIIRGEFLGVPVTRAGSVIEDRVLTVVAHPYLHEAIMNARVTVRVIENEDNIYIAQLG